MSGISVKKWSFFCSFILIIHLIGCANTELLEKRIARLEEENAALRRETTDINIKLEETNNILYVMQDKITEQAKSIEELRNSNSIKSMKEKPITPAKVHATDDAEKLYRSSLDLLNSGKVDAAEQGFRDFLEKYPEHPYADNAQYWLGECYYARKDYNSAITEFNLVLTNYSHGDKICDATLKIGYSYIQLGDVDNGTKYLNEVMTNCNDTPVARKAAEKLKLLGRN